MMELDQVEWRLHMTIGLQTGRRTMFAYRFANRSSCVNATLLMPCFVKVYSVIVTATRVWWTCCGKRIIQKVSKVCIEVTLRLLWASCRMSASCSSAMTVSRKLTQVLRVAYCCGLLLR